LLVFGETFKGGNMKRKLLLLAGVLAFIAWTSTVDATITCTCSYCGTGSTERCYAGFITNCADYSLNYCVP
jgi:hypothetical protein